jgi:hypothetical protein
MFAMLGACALIVLFLALGFFRRSTWQVERSITIHAKPESVQALIGDLRRWPEWMPWSKERDASVEYTFQGDGIGSEILWEGKKYGKNRLTLTASTPPSGIGYDLCLAGRDDATHGAIRLEPGAGPSLTRVVWRDGGDVGWNPMYRWILPAIERALEHDFDRGLELLKKRAETGA